MKKILLLMFVMVLVVGVASAGDEHVFTQGQVTDLKIPCVIDDEYCSAASSCNITVLDKDQQALVDNEQMTNNGNYHNYTLNISTTSENGVYTWTSQCCDGGLCGVGSDYFTITPSGQSGNENIYFFIFIILMIYGITGFGFFGRHIPMSLLGGMAMIGLGIYMINQGVIIYRDWITNYFSYITMGLGAIVSITAAIALINDDY